MANKFTKLNIGNAVASSGGRVWKKLSGLPAIGTPLEDCSWEDISTISEQGLGENYFAIGDTKSVHIKGAVGILEFDEILYVYIIGFNHNSEIEGNGITFGTFKTAEGKDVALADSYYRTNVKDGTKCLNTNHWSGYNNYGGWAGCDLRYDILGSTDVAPSGYGAKVTTDRVGYDATENCTSNPVPNTLMSALPADLRGVMKPMTIYSDNTGGNSNVEENVTVSIDYLPLIAEFEVWGKASRANSYEQNKQKQYAYFVAGNNKAKSTHPITDSAQIWLTRSSAYKYADSFCSVQSSTIAGTTQPAISTGIAPIFKV